MHYAYAIHRSSRRKLNRSGRVGSFGREMRPSSIQCSTSWSHRVKLDKGRKTQSHVWLYRGVHIKFEAAKSGFSVQVVSSRGGFGSHQSLLRLWDRNHYWLHLWSGGPTVSSRCSPQSIQTKCGHTHAQVRPHQTSREILVKSSCYNGTLISLKGQFVCLSV